MLSPECRSVVIQSLSVGLSLRESARLAKTTVSSVREEMARDPEFLVDVRSAKCSLKTKALELVTQSIEEGSHEMALAYLKLLEERATRRAQTLALRLQNKVLRQKASPRKFHE